MPSWCRAVGGRWTNCNFSGLQSSGDRPAIIAILDPNCSCARSSRAAPEIIGKFCPNSLRLQPGLCPHYMRLCPDCVRPTCNHRRLPTIRETDSKGQVSPKRSLRVGVRYSHYGPQAVGRHSHRMVENVVRQLPRVSKFYLFALTFCHLLRRWRI
jgi:hypothetical protein